MNRPPIYSRPAKPLRIPPTRRERFEGPTAQPLAAPVMVDKATECHVTPPDVAARMVRYLGASCDMLTLEPSTGTGNLARALLADGHSLQKLCLVERHIGLANRLHAIGAPVVNECFLDYADRARGKVEFPRVIMNPPFSVENDKTAYMTHIYHAFSMLTDNGIMYAVVPNGWEFNQASKFRAFREFVGLHGVSKEKFPSGTFKESGTMIETTVIELRKNTPISEVHTQLAALYIDNNRMLIKAAQDCKNVQEFVTFLYDKVWKEVYMLGGFVHIGSVDAEELYTRLKEDTQ
jgi:predicted RNA methylase